MLLIIIGAILAGTLIVVGLVSFALGVVVGSLVARLRQTGRNKVIVIGNKEMEALTDEIKEKNSEAGIKIEQMLAAEEKLTLDETKDGYEVGSLKATDTSRDDFKNGGVVFASGEYITYDDHRNEHRGTMKC